MSDERLLVLRGRFGVNQSFELRTTLLVGPEQKLLQQQSKTGDFLNP
jgi:hypothetical protein